MPVGAGFCPGCGRPMQSMVRVEGRIGIFPLNIAGALAYLTFVPAAAFLLIEPYKRDRFVRFHSLQCLMAWVVALALAAALRLASIVLFMIPVLGPLLVVLLGVMVCLAAVFLWGVMIVKALQGEMFRLPFLGQFAEHYAGGETVI